MSRIRLRATAATALAVLALAAPPTLAHSPDPAIAWPLYTPDDTLQFRWKENEVPPSKMRDAVVAAADDANGSRGSRAPSIVYAAGGSSTVEYGANVFCGVAGLACADGWDAPDTFRVAFRSHGWQFDWGKLQWCQLQSTPQNGCYDIENVGLDEFGHVLGLNHHANYSSESDYLDAVVQTVSHARAKVGWNAHDFGRCDTAKLQLRYDMVNSARKYSTCLDIATALSMSASDRSISLGETVTFTVVVQVADSASYEKLRSNWVSERRIVLERRAPGSSTWTQVAVVPPIASSGMYQIRLSPTTTYDWRGYFYKPTDEGLRASSSAPFTITVSGTCPTCPQAPNPVSTREARP
ncbi:MAG TPA: hypothetical protein VFV72_15950 [Candidatus Limnocylindrales bacterium]|nr:hypothetical protein [Candidatus Limnocylindrales bacterium]